LLAGKRLGSVSMLDSCRVIDWLEKAGGVCKIVFSGGEPFLSPGLVSACEGITRTHFVGIITNFVLPAVVEFSQRIDPSRVVFVNASLHPEQLEKHKLVGKYIDNYHLYESKGFPVNASVVAYPGLRDKIQNYRKYFLQQGIHFQCNNFIGWYNNLRYPDAYTKEDIELYQLDETMFKKPPRLCNAGHNVCVIDVNGDIHPCFDLQRNIGSLYSEINWSNTLINCNVKDCRCPLYLYEGELFDAAAGKTGQE
jgi:MoaA/NifB/PqqE/SkfB family radical SAM enzyme